MGHQVFISYSTRDILSEKSDYTEWDLLGIKVSDRGDLKIDNRSAALEEGILVEDVDKDSPAFWNGICSGDVIFSIDGNPVQSKEILRIYIKNSLNNQHAITMGLTTENKRRSVKMIISDRLVADIICSRLESVNIQCWIDHRDIVAGDNWLNSIIDAVIQSKILVLVFSSNSNKSLWVVQEVIRALRENITIIPFVIEKVVPQGALRALEDRCQWLDASSPPLQKHLDLLVNTLHTQLEKRNRVEHRNICDESDKYKITECIFRIGNTCKIIVNLQKKKVIKVGRINDEEVEAFNDINFQFFNVSRSHLHLIFKESPASLYIQDQGSSFGTVVNKERLFPGRELMIEDGDIIFIGKIITYKFLKKQGFFLLKNVTQRKNKGVFTWLSGDPDQGKYLPATSSEIVLIYDFSVVNVSGTGVRLEIDKKNGNIVSDSVVKIERGTILI